MTDEQAKGSGNSTTALARLLNQLNIPTLLAILFMNGWGIRTTEEKGAEMTDEQRAAYRKLNQLYESLEDFENRQKTTVDNVKAILSGQSQQLSNQGKMLESQDRLLKELHDWQRSKTQ